MSFWGKLAKIGLAGAAGIAAPFSGGASLMSLPAILGAAGAIAPVVGGMAKGRAEGKVQEDVSGQRRDRLALQRAELANKYGLDSTRMGNVNAQQGYENQMGQAKYRMDALGTRAAQARHGDLQANVQDVVASHPRASIVHFQGGLRPSAMGPNAREAGRLLSEGAIGAMRNGEALPESPNFQAAPGLQLPNLSNAPQSGFMDKLLGAAGPGLSLMGAVEPYFNKPNPVGIPSPTPGVEGLPGQFPPPQATLNPGIPPPPLLPSRRAPEDWRLY